MNISKTQILSLDTYQTLEQSPLHSGIEEINKQILLEWLIYSFYLILLLMLLVFMLASLKER